MACRRNAFGARQIVAGRVDTRREGEQRGGLGDVDDPGVDTRPGRSEIAQRHVERDQPAQSLESSGRSSSARSNSDRAAAILSCRANSIPRWV